MPAMTFETRYRLGETVKAQAPGLKAHTFVIAQIRIQTLLGRQNWTLIEYRSAVYIKGLEPYWRYGKWYPEAWVLGGVS